MVRKAVVMAGGLATRLRPLTTATNKHMLPVYDRPMIQRVIETVVASGITDILVYLNNSFAQPVMQLLQDGEEFGCFITYVYQREVISLGKSILAAQRFVGQEPFMVMLGDSFYRAPLPLPEDIKVPHMWVMPLDPKFDDFRKYAEVTLSPDKTRVIDITEKPERQVTSLIQTGAWIFGPDVFPLSARLLREEKKEVQVRTIVRHYLDTRKMWATMLPPESFLDLGTIDALLLGGNLAKVQRKATRLTAAE